MIYHDYRIGDICRMVKGTFSSTKTTPGSYPLVVTATNRRTADSFDLEGPAVCIPLISSTGHGDAAIHRLHFQEGVFALANLLVALMPMPDSPVDAEYLYWYLTAKKDDLLVPLMRGTANVSLKEKDIADVSVSLPPLPEQRRIVARVKGLLTKVEEARGLRGVANRNASLAWSSLAKKVFASFDANVRLADVVTLRGGGTPSKANPGYWGGDIPWVTPKDMKRRKIDSAQDQITNEAIENSSAKLILPGAVLIVVRGMILAHTVPVAVLDVPAAINQDMKAMLTNNRLMPEFLSAWLWSHNDMVLSLVERSTHDTRKLETSKLLDITIPVPSLDEQQQALCKLDRSFKSVSAVREHQSQTQQELDSLPASILARAFAGAL